ncbi:hypothetical protein S40285_08529 [Stachybotrys chlorohalonatus IBT 40285]|uniref:Uncharacterized protein n=1 Tax=Stachybotrys chlorohalonatus (strain IBT 40285) TaxID=1283841 RepID=A0A084QR66_STAC4|nr:hypothetical protein S40285_08529 [Stachybotrys chlorohalonata IBT 40285]
MEQLTGGTWPVHRDPPRRPTDPCQRTPFSSLRGSRFPKALVPHHGSHAPSRLPATCLRHSALETLPAKPSIPFHDASSLSSSLPASVATTAVAAAAAAAAGMDFVSRLWKSHRQAFPSAPRYTEKDVPSLAGKVYIVTGANTGVGKALAKILYAADARVYVAARSSDKASAAIAEIKQEYPSSNGELAFLPLDLADLSTIKGSVQQFLDKETRLDVLFNNAGVMHPADGSVTAQGYELQLGVNCLGSFLLTKLLTSILIATAKTQPEGKVRVVWVASSAAEMPYFSPAGGMPMDNLDYHIPKDRMTKYAVSKAGNYFHGTEYARRYKADGIVSVPLNPGNLSSDLWRSQVSVARMFLNTFVLHEPKYGAYTELFAGISDEVTLEKTGSWVVPWGRFESIRPDIQEAAKTKEEGGTGNAQAFWEWSEEQVKPFI